MQCESTQPCTAYLVLHWFRLLWCDWLWLHNLVRF